MGVVVEAIGPLGDRQKDLLREVGRVGVLQAVAAGEAVHQAAVQLHELPPGGAVAWIAQTGEQAGSG